MNVKACQQCGRSFVADKPHRQFCSYRCSNGSRRKIEARDCECCEQRFLPHEDSGRFCSQECVWRHKRAQHSSFCSVDGCRGVYAAKGLCEQHYQAQRHLNQREERLERGRKWLALNREEQLELKRQSYAADPEKMRERCRQWRATHLERARENDRRRYQAAPERTKNRNYRRRLQEQQGGSHTPQEWRDLCERYGNRCLACGLSFKLTVDHVIPLTKGGTNDVSNLQPLCGSCNRSKGVNTTDYRPHPNTLA